MKTLRPADFQKLVRSVTVPAGWVVDFDERWTTDDDIRVKWVRAKVLELDSFCLYIDFIAGRVSVNLLDRKQRRLFHPTDLAVQTLQQVAKATALAAEILERWTVLKGA